MAYTPANVHDSKVFDQLLTGNEEQVFADSAYARKKKDQALKLIT